jgi:hypothetical protein
VAYEVIEFEQDRRSHHQLEKAEYKWETEQTLDLDSPNGERSVYCMDTGLDISMLGKLSGRRHCSTSTESE